MEQIVIFSLDEHIYSLPINTVEKVIHAVEITMLPKAPEIIAGIINVKGQIVAVIDMRKRFNCSSREIHPDDQFLLVNTAKRQVALWVDSVVGIQDIASIQYSETINTLPYAEFIKGVVKIEGEIVLIYDLEQFLSISEEKQLENAINNV